MARTRLTLYNPVGPATGLYRVSRGGSFGTPTTFLRSANRSGMLPDDQSWLVGFRVVQAPMPATGGNGQTAAGRYQARLSAIRSFLKS